MESKREVVISLSLALSFSCCCFLGTSRATTSEEREIDRGRINPTNPEG